MNDYWVTVCDSCLRVSCWHYEYPCEDYLSAGLVDKKASELEKLALESPDYFSRECIERITGRPPMEIV